jgi:hypothetical protein
MHVQKRKIGGYKPKEKKYRVLMSFISMMESKAMLPFWAVTYSNQPTTTSKFDVRQ